MMKNFISGEITIKDLKEFIKDVPDDFKIEVIGDYYSTPISDVSINKSDKLVHFSQGV